MPCPSEISNRKDQHHTLHEWRTQGCQTSTATFWAGCVNRGRNGFHFRQPAGAETCFRIYTQQQPKLWRLYGCWHRRRNGFLLPFAFHNAAMQRPLTRSSFLWSFPTKYYSICMQLELANLLVCSGHLHLRRRRSGEPFCI